MACNQQNDNAVSCSIGAFFLGCIKLAIAIPLIVWLFPRISTVQDFRIFFTETLPFLFRLFLFGDL